MEKRYESEYARYVHKKPKTYWSSEDEVKSKLLKVDLTKSTIEAGGLPIISDGKTAYIDASDNHTVFEAISGMKKSISAYMPLIYTLGKTNNIIIATDPKGELYGRTSGYLKNQGFDVYCLDFRTFDKDAYNILSYPACVYRFEDKDRGSALMSVLINALAEKQFSSSRVDPFWPATATSFMNGTAALMLNSYPNIDEINILNWAEYNTEQGLRLLNELISQIKTENTAMINLKTVLAEPEKTLLSTVATASSFLASFLQNNKLARMLSHSTFSLEDLCKPKTALFLITDDTTTTCDTIVGIIVNQIQSYLINEAYKNNGKLDTRVNFLLDEFASYPIPNMVNALATHRSRNIRYFLCVQSLSGLKQRYEHYEALLANCGSTVFMGSTEQALLEKVSEQCGKTEITPNGKERPLISPAELMTLKKSWESKEVIYMNLGDNICYCATLPAIEAYDIGNYPAPQYKIDHPRVKHYTLSDLLHDISLGKAQMPFSEKEPEQKLIKKKRQQSDTAEIPEAVRRELEQKFTEIFGTVDGDEE